MESYLPITHLNDFVFCPRSIFVHQLFGQYSPSLYHRQAQTLGRIKHESIEKRTYSTAKRYLINYAVYSTQYRLCGKVDIYDQKEKKLVERKTHIKTIYDGYVFQLHAYYFCLQEMGHEVCALFFHSLKDNKRYPVPLPDQAATSRFEELIKNIHSFDLEVPFSQNQNKCRQCIYNPLCDSYETDSLKEQIELC